MKKQENLTIRFMPYSEISHLGSLERIKKILGIVLENKLIILQGRLKPEEEAKLIENTMTLIGNIKGFQGIEISSLSGTEDKTLFERFRKNLIRLLIGEQDSITLIGPANIVKDIKKDPKKIELILKRG
ncbi:MAG: DUF2073 domain-containing protein [Candidatus Pacearchaeota archaeon]